MTGEVLLSGLEPCWIVSINRSKESGKYLKCTVPYTLIFSVHSWHASEHSIRKRTTKTPSLEDQQIN